MSDTPTQTNPASTRSTRLRHAPKVAALAATAALVAACGGEAGDTQDTAADTADTPAATETATTAADAETTAEQGAAGEGFATAEILDPSGESLGTAQFSEVGGGTEIAVETEGLEPGFHGLHIHAIGECEPDSAAPDDPEDTGDFMSAGGHLAGDDPEADHPDHAGDLPPLYVTEDGQGQMTTLTDRLDADMLLSGEGTSVMVHADADNLAHIPERYAPEGADENTLSAGDGGSRVACGVVME